MATLTFLAPGPPFCKAITGNILSFYIRDEILGLSKLSEIDPCCKTNYRNIEDIYLGAIIMVHLLTNLFKDAAIEKVFRNVKDFVWES